MFQAYMSTFKDHLDEEEAEQFDDIKIIFDKDQDYTPVIKSSDTNEIIENGYHAVFIDEHPENDSAFGETNHETANGEAGMGSRPSSRANKTKLRKGTAGILRSGSGKQLSTTIFLSYHQDYYQHVIMIKYFLELDGYGCSMIKSDNSEMVQNSEPLIDVAKVVILCMSNNYCNSSACVQEAVYANSKHKTLIPLCLEKFPWPPSGTLLSLLEDMTFIRFYESGKEHTKNKFGTFWTDEKFRKLTDHLLEIVKPEKRLRSAAAKRDMPDLANSVTLAQTSSTSDSTTKSKLFLSYQWKHQKEVMILQEFLETWDLKCSISTGEISATESSKQSNDEAIKNADVVILCLNSFYPHCKQCTKEVFQARSMKKPIIVLVMEPLQYPPDGKQNYVLKKYQPVAFFRGTKSRWNQTPWPGSRFHTLMRKIKEAGLTTKFSPEPELIRQNTLPLKVEAQVQHQSTHSSSRGSALDRSKRYDVIISCSPCATDHAEKLAAELCHSGYAVSFANYAVDSLNNMKFRAVICMLNHRYINSSLAANEMKQVSIRIGGKCIIPILVDENLDYPPRGPLERVLYKLKPINCAAITSGIRSWGGSVQFQNILNRLESANRVKSGKSVADNPSHFGVEKAEEASRSTSRRPRSLPTIKRRPFTAPGKTIWNSDKVMKNETDTSKDFQDEDKLPDINAVMRSSVDLT